MSRLIGDVVVGESYRILRRSYGGLSGASVRVAEIVVEVEKLWGGKTRNKRRVRVELLEPYKIDRGSRDGQIIPAGESIVVDAKDLGQTLDEIAAAHAAAVERNPVGYEIRDRLSALLGIEPRQIKPIDSGWRGQPQTVAVELSNDEWVAVLERIEAVR